MDSSSSQLVVLNQLQSSGSNRARDLRRKKKKINTQESNPNNDIITSNKFSWKSETTQQIYSSKLLQSLRNLQICPPSSTSSSAPRPSRAVREAADKALAVAARGRTRWSRAILSSRFRIQCLNKKLRRKRHRIMAAGVNRSPPQRKPRVEILKLKGKGNSLPAIQRKVNVLGRLVPGCRKETLPVILEEATDYIPALEMQIRAMRSVLTLFGAGEGSIMTENSANN